MQYKLSICALVLTSLATSPAQVVSHATNSAKPQTQATQAAQPSGKPVARVNGAVLTDKDLTREELLIFPYARQHGGAIPPEMEPGIRQGALQMIIFEELVYQDARKHGVTVAPERLRQAQAEFRKQFSSTSEYQQFLKAEFEGNEQ